MPPTGESVYPGMKWVPMFCFFVCGFIMLQTFSLRSPFPPCPMLPSLSPYPLAESACPHVGDHAYVSVASPLGGLVHTAASHQRRCRRYAQNSKESQEPNRRRTVPGVSHTSSLESPLSSSLSPPLPPWTASSVFIQSVITLSGFRSWRSSAGRPGHAVALCHHRRWRTIEAYERIAPLRERRKRPPPATLSRSSLPAVMRRMTGCKPVQEEPMAANGLEGDFCRVGLGL